MGFYFGLTEDSGENLKRLHRKDFSVVYEGATPVSNLASVDRTRQPDMQTVCIFSFQIFRLPCDTSCHCDGNNSCQYLLI